jgi:hypothetical protein
MTTAAVSNYANSPDIVILTNSTFTQAVKKTALGVVAANFWTNGTSSADLITVSDKSSVMTLEQSNSIVVGISDPTQTNKGTITATLNRAAQNLVSADPGVTVVQLSPQIILSVNVNGSHGKSFQAALTYPNFVLPVNATANSTNTTLSFSTQIGFEYQVQYKANITDAVWISVGAVVTGNGATQSIDVPIIGPNNFYRVMLE